MATAKLPVGKKLSLTAAVGVKLTTRLPAPGLPAMSPTRGPMPVPTLATVSVVRVAVAAWSPVRCVIDRRGIHHRNRGIHHGRRRVNHWSGGADDPGRTHRHEGDGWQRQTEGDVNASCLSRVDRQGRNSDGGQTEKFVRFHTCPFDRRARPGIQPGALIEIVPPYGAAMGGTKPAARASPPDCSSRPAPGYLSWPPRGSITASKSKNNEQVELL